MCYFNYKKWYVTLLMVISLFAWGCDFIYDAKEAPSMPSEAAELQYMNEMDTMAKSIVMFTTDAGITKEVYKSVGKAFDGETNVLVVDLLNHESFKRGYSKQFQDLNLQQFKRAFETRFQLDQNKQGKTASDTLYQWLVQYKVQIYWPYEELWDGVSRPTLVVAPLEDNAESAMGYSLDVEGNLQRVLVDEAYMKAHPVWVLSSNERVEDDLSLQQNSISPTKMEKTQSGTMVTIRELQASQGWDSVFQGGPEFVFVRPDAGVFQSGDTSIGSTPIRKTVEVSRSIGTNWGWYNELFDDDWAVDKTKQTILVYEADTSPFASSYKLGIEVKVGLVTLKGEVPVNIGSRSDLAFIEDFTRENFMYLARYGWPAPLSWGCRPGPCSDSGWGIWKGSNGSHTVEWTFAVTEW